MYTADSSKQQIDVNESTAFSSFFVCTTIQPSKCKVFLLKVTGATRLRQILVKVSKSSRLLSTNLKTEEHFRQVVAIEILRHVTQQPWANREQTNLQRSHPHMTKNSHECRGCCDPLNFRFLFRRRLSSQKSSDKTHWGMTPPLFRPSQRGNVL